MSEIIKKLAKLVPGVDFIVGDNFLWSPANRTITYNKQSSGDKLATWSLLHETGHATLGHQNYESDIDLLLMEVAAWEKAKELAQNLNLKIDEDHIQDCLDTYRDWLHQRSTCPRCGLVSLQTSSFSYQCPNCSCTWKVTSSRFCRPYRLSKPTKTKTKTKVQTIFK
ncbi:MAG TPA: hypothetical protein VLF39_00135 [Candidatus Saccharimonadales bacterium]|nr:hypothetical protein [Candidatus Saccharimonadales bacterium]